MKLIIATQNNNKVIEFKKIISDNKLDFDVYSLKDLNILDEVEEDGSTLDENAYKKALGYYNIINKLGYTDYIVIADDTGLFVDALDGRPGIYSARYAGDDATYLDNRKKLLKELKNIENRDAHFCTTMCMIYNQDIKYFYGKTYGKILKKHVGNNEFGYDKIFYSNEIHKSFGIASLEEKNLVSHRGKAMKAVIEYLKQL